MWNFPRRIDRRICWLLSLPLSCSNAATSRLKDEIEFAKADIFVVIFYSRQSAELSGCTLQIWNWQKRGEKQKNSGRIAYEKNVATANSNGGPALHSIFFAYYDHNSSLQKIWHHLTESFSGQIRRSPQPAFIALITPVFGLCQFFRNHAKIMTSCITIA